MKTPILTLATIILAAIPALAMGPGKTRHFDPDKDLLSLHYDHAPDKDDGQSAAADRTIVELLFGHEWIKKHVAAVSGAYGKNAKKFNSKSDAVMDAAWNNCGGWMAAHTNREQVVDGLTKRWGAVLQDGGDVWIKEGGQSDVTSDVVKLIRRRLPDFDTAKRIHVVQHSNWNEKQTTDAALDYVKKHTDYIRIRDANNYLNIKGGNRSFEQAARQHPVFGDVWKAAFAYYNPEERLDFSDTGELMRILGLGEMGIDRFRQRFLDKTDRNSNKEYGDPKRFEASIKRFEASDREKPPPQGAIVCVGSSSMRGWHETIHDDLAPLTVIARGFGGSNMNDALHYTDRIVLPYKPRAVVVYEGDNDVAQGIPPQKIADTFQAFIQKIHKELPQCRVYFLSIKPSIKRWHMWPAMKKANELIAAKCGEDSLLTYVDVSSGMLNDEGKPRKDIFKKDNLHMNRDGYVIWRDAVKPVLMKSELQYQEQKPHGAGNGKREQ